MYIMSHAHMRQPLPSRLLSTGVHKCTCTGVLQLKGLLMLGRGVGGGTHVAPAEPIQPQLKLGCSMDAAVLSKMVHWFRMLGCWV